MRRPARPGILPWAVGCLLLACSACLGDGEAAEVGTPPRTGAELAAEAEAKLFEAIRDGDLARGMAVLTAAREKGLRAGAYHYLKAKALAAQGDAAGVEEQLRGAIQEDPTFVDAYLRLGEILEQRGLWLDAVELYRRAIGVEATATEAYLSLARIYLGQKRNASAIEVLKQGEAAVADDAGLAMALADAYEQLGQRGDALREYRRAAGLAKGKTRLRALLKVADMSLGSDPPGALAYYRDAVNAGAQLTEELYDRIARAMDETDWGALQDPWKQLCSYAEGAESAPEREDVYIGLAAALAEAREVMALADRLAPEQPQKSEHALRRLLTSVVCEALTAGLSYLDTGDPTLMDSARARYAEALAIKGRLEDGAGSPAQ